MLKTICLFPNTCFCFIFLEIIVSLIDLQTCTINRGIIFFGEEGSECVVALPTFKIVLICLYTAIIKYTTTKKYELKKKVIKL